jgi:hypothetical protein
MRQATRKDGGEESRRLSLSQRCNCLGFVQSTEEENGAFAATICTTPTQFTMSEEELFREFMNQLHADCPAMVASRDDFLTRLGTEYDRLTLDAPPTKRAKQENAIRHK